MTRAKLHRYVGLAFAVLLLGGFMDTGEKRNPQLAPLDHTVMGYMASNKYVLREEFELIGRYLVCTIESGPKTDCAKESGWPTLNYLALKPKIKQQYPDYSEYKQDDFDDTHTQQAIYYYGQYLQNTELPALKTRILIAHSLLFLFFLIALYKREAVGRFLCNTCALLWATLQRLPRAILGVAKGLHGKV